MIVIDEICYKDTPIHHDLREKWDINRADKGPCG